MVTRLLNLRASNFRWVVFPEEGPPTIKTRIPISVQGYGGVISGTTPTKPMCVLWVISAFVGKKNADWQYAGIELVKRGEIFGRSRLNNGEGVLRQLTPDPIPDSRFSIFDFETVVLKPKQNALEEY